MSAARPFTFRVPDEALADLRERLRRTRFPDQAPGAGDWSQGVPLDWLRALAAYWQDGFDWRAAEARLAAIPNFRAEIDGVDLHFLRAEGQGPNPLPLLLSHGWPGSVFEFLSVIPRLADPARFGGDPADAFTVIAPSLPGYGLSFAPGQKRFGVEGIAAILARLMTEVLGFPRFGAQGGDWGSFVTARLGATVPDKVVGIHLNMMPVRRDPDAVQDPSPAERLYLEELRHWQKEETGYSAIQGTRPQTLAYGLTDSPAGLLAWIAEKFAVWTDNGGDVFSAVSRDDILADVSLYWFTGAIGSSFFPYYARSHGPWPVPGPVGVPTGYASFPREILHPPRSVAEKTFTDIRRWTDMERGGHFAALEQPDALAAEIAAFFRPLRRAG